MLQLLQKIYDYIININNSLVMNTLNNMTNPNNMPAMPYGGILDADGCKMLARKIFATYDSRLQN